MNSPTHAFFFFNIFLFSHPFTFYLFPHLTFITNVITLLFSLFSFSLSFFFLCLAFLYNDSLLYLSLPVSTHFPRILLFSIIAFIIFLVSSSHFLHHQRFLFSFFFRLLYHNHSILLFSFLLSFFLFSTLKHYISFLAVLFSRSFASS